MVTVRVGEMIVHCKLLEVHAVASQLLRVQDTRMSLTLANPSTGKQKVVHSNHSLSSTTSPIDSEKPKDEKPNSKITKATDGHAKDRRGPTALTNLSSTSSTIGSEKSKRTKAKYGQGS